MSMFMFSLSFFLFVLCIFICVHVSNCWNEIPWQSLHSKETFLLAEAKNKLAQVMNLKKEPCQPIQISSVVRNVSTQVGSHYTLNKPDNKVDFHKMVYFCKNVLWLLKGKLGSIAETTAPALHSPHHDNIEAWQPAR